MATEKKSFFTEEFYTNVFATLNVFNELNAKKYEYEYDFDMYESGEYLFYSVIENDTTKHILSRVISDLEAYKAYNKDGFSTDEAGTIALCALQHDHVEHFGTDDEIMWDRNTEEFVFRGMLE